ncbi:uncharacterized protein At2g34160 [Brachypodium distachyon]|uniref:DNA/RNA-binding protein Alba-like domain-containing protein n=1 Tax=Brachypodium distachyon TaxID=15368 RepID=I1IIC0_BRADI|nr:uncharacterized protein At2g34160 [Brachypodium distachyon]KQJ86689.1 hypothetical protein BRADI_4g07160v3 [Brachypodium distachyon]|eukprot:XP_003575507.1 uncharacterized protein At2g34160 [Brachypodium distachyon]
MQAVRPAAREEEAQEVREVVKEEAPQEKEVAVVGEHHHHQQQSKAKGSQAAAAEEEEELVDVEADQAEADGEAEAGASAKKNRIQVSTNKKPLYFYVNLAKRYMQNYDEVELSALGMAIGTVVTVSEILKNNGLATEKKILTSTIGTKDELKGRLVRKAKIEILLCKSENFNSIMSSKKSPKSADDEIKV